MALIKSLTTKWTITENKKYIGIPLCAGEYFGSSNLSLRVEWGDGQETIITDTASTATEARVLFHVYESSGDKTVTIYGGYGDDDADRRIAFQKSPYPQKARVTRDNLKQILNWDKFYIHGQGDFRGCTILEGMPSNGMKFILSTDPSAQIQSEADGTFLCISTFEGCEALNSNIENWGDSLLKCTSMNSMFKNANLGKPWLGKWRPDNVTDMTSMFEGSNFNHPSISKWGDKNQPTRIGNVVSMANMFKDSPFDQYIAYWFRDSIHSIKSMSGMFSGTSEFGKGAAKGADKIFHWQMYGVEDVSDMFRDNQFFDGWLAGWFHRDQSKNKSPDGSLAVKNMSGMFANSVFGQGEAKNGAAIGKWKMDTVENTSEMFKDNQHFDYYLADWFRAGNAPAGGYVIKNMSGMFAGSSIYGKGWGKNGRAITKWDMSTVEDVSDMFRGNQHFDYFIGDWFKKTAGKTYAVKNMSGMFADSVFGAEWGRSGRRISVWDMSSVENISEMFKDNQHFDYNLGDWFKRDGTVYKVKDMSGLFENSKFGHANAASGERKTSSTAQWEMKSVETVARMFKDNISYNGYLNDMFHWNNGPYVVTDMSQMFENAKYWRPLNQWGGGGMKSVENVSRMFAGSSDFNQDIKPWFNNVSKAWKVKNMSGMFDGNTKFNKSIDDWWVGNVEDMSSMFKNNTGYNQSLNNLFKTEPTSGFKIKNMESMFEGNTKFNNNLGDWKMHTVTSTKNMFKNSVFDKWIINWFKDENDEKNLQIKDMSGMFAGSDAAFGASTQNNAINNWNTKSVQDMSGMFNDNPNFNKWVAGWSTDSLLSWGRFKNNSDWTVGILPFPDDIVETNMEMTEEIDLDVDSSVTFNLKPAGGNLGTDKLLVRYHVDSDSEPGFVSITQPDNGTASFVINNVEDGIDTNSMDSSIDVTYVPDYNTISTGVETFEVHILDPNGNVAKATFTITITDTQPTVANAPQPDPIEVEFRWHDVTVSINGEDETVKVLQVKNALEPTHASFSRDMTQWWTVYGYTGSADYDLGNVVWPDVAVATNYGDFHDNTIVLPDDGGTITFQADDNTGYLQANFTPGSDYEFYDEAAASSQLFMFSGDSNSDSASYDVAWPWPARKSDAGPPPLVAGPQSGVTTPPGTVTGDLTKELFATPNWDGYIHGHLSFVDDTYGANYANNDTQQYYVSYENLSGPDNYTGNIYVDFMKDGGQMKYSVYTDDYSSFRGDVSFDVVWPNDRSAALQLMEINGDIPGSTATYSDPDNGVYITSWNEGSDYNFSVTADGTSEVWELIRDDGGSWGPDSGFEWEFDFYPSTNTNSDGFSTHVYPAGTVIELTGGSDGGSLSPEQTEIAYNQMNRAEIRVRASDPIAINTPGTVTGDINKTVQTTDGYFRGYLSFNDDEGISHLSDTNYYGWYSAGVTQRSGPDHNGSYGLSLVQNSLNDVGIYDYMINDQVGSYVDVYDITWYDDAGYLNTNTVTITVNTPSDRSGSWSGDLTKSMARNWSEAEYNNDASNNWGNMTGNASLSDQDGVWNNSAVISTQPTGGSVTLSSTGGSVQWDYTPSDGNVALNSDFTDSFEINYIDDLGFDNKQTITVTITQYDPSAAPSISPASLIYSIDAWSQYHSTNSSQTSAYINLVVDNIPSGASIMSVNYDSPTRGMMSGSGQYLTYSPYEGEEDYTESIEVTVEYMDMMDYNVNGQVTGTLQITVAALPAQQDFPGTTSGTIQGTVNMNTAQNGSQNMVTGYVYYNDPNGTMNSGNPESISSPPQKGIANLGYGYWTYTPADDMVGTDTFIIQWTDDIGNTNTQTITITIVDTSDQIATITGDLALTATETPMGVTPVAVTGTIRIHDPNGLTSPNMSTGDYNTTLLVSTVDDNTVDVLVTYTPQSGQNQPVTVQINWTDDHYHNGDASFTVNFTRPAVESDVTVLDLGGTTEITGWTFNNIDAPATLNFNDIIIKANNGLSKIVIADTDSSLTDTSDDNHPFLRADFGLINTMDNASYGATGEDILYKVNIKVDESYDWSSQSPINSPITGGITLMIFDGYDRRHTNNTPAYTYVGTNFADQLGTAYLNDITDTYGQSVTTTNGLSDIILYHPAPLGNGITANIIFEDVAGVNNAAATMTVTNIDSSTINVIQGYDGEGSPTLEMTGQDIETDGSFSIEWQDDRGVVNVSTFTYQVVTLPDVAGEVSHIELPDGQVTMPTDGVFDVSVVDSNAMVLTVSVADANGVGAPSNIVQPTNGSATVVDTGGHYIVTYTPASTDLWLEDILQFDWADGDGNSNGTITIKFTEAIDPPSSSDAATQIVLLDDQKTKALDIPMGESGGTLNFKILVKDSDGLPTDDAANDVHALVYDQPEFSDEFGNVHDAGSVSITLAADQSIPQELFYALRADNNYPIFHESEAYPNPFGGAAGSYARVYNVSVTLPTVTVASNPSNPHLVAEQLLLDINTQIIGHDYQWSNPGKVTVTPYPIQVNVIGDPGPTVKLEYSEPINLSHLPTHDGSSSISGNVVTITGATNFGAASDASNNDKTVAAGKLVRVQSFGRTVTNWDYAFRGSTNLTSIPYTLKGAATSMREMFAGCTGLTIVDADAWVTDSVTSMEGMFNGCTSLTKLYASWNTSNVTNFNAMFAYTGFTNITDIVGLFPNSPTGWDFNTAATFANMFEGSSLTSFNWTNTQIGTGLTDFSSMFKDCTSLVTVNITNLNLDSATNVSSMFEGCTSLTSIIGLDSLNTNNVEFFDSMFKNASALSSLDMGEVSTFSAQSMTSMFEGTGSLTNLTGINTLNTTNIQPAGLKDMFKDSGVINNTVDISNWSGLNQLPADIAGGADTSFLIVPLSIGGGDPIVVATHEISQMTRNDRVVTDLKVKDYTLPDNGNSFWDWRRPYGYWGNAPDSEDKYYILEANNGSSTIQYLLGQSDLRDWTNDNSSGIYGLPPEGYFLYLVPVNVDDHRGLYSLNVTSDPNDPRFDTWQNADYPGQEVIFVDLNTPTASELDAWLPTDGSAQIDVTVKVADARGNLETLVVSTGSVEASDLLSLIQSDVTSRFGESMDFNLSRNNYNSLAEDVTVNEAPVMKPFKDGEMTSSNNGIQIFPDAVASLPENSGKSPMERPTFSADRITDLLSGVYDSTHNSPKLSTVAMAMIIPPQNHNLTYDDALESSLIPDFEITVYSRTDKHYQLGNDGSNSYLFTDQEDDSDLGANPNLTMSVGDRLQLERTSTGHNIAIKDSDGVIVCSGLTGSTGSDNIMFTPTKPGTYTYYCVSHPGSMSGSIVVDTPSDKTSLTAGQIKSKIGSLDTFTSKRLDYYIAAIGTSRESVSSFTHASFAGNNGFISPSSSYPFGSYDNQPGYHPTLDSYYTFAVPTDGKITIEYKFTNKYGAEVISHNHMVTSQYTEHTAPQVKYVELEYESTDRVFIPRITTGLPGTATSAYTTTSSFAHVQGNVKTSDFSHMVIDFDPDGGSNLDTSSRYYSSNYDTTPIVPTGTTGVNLWHTVNWQDTIPDQDPASDWFDATIEPSAGWDVQTLPDQNGVSVQQLNQDWVDQYGFNNVFEALYAGNYDLSNIAENINIAQTNPDIQGYYRDALSYGESGQYYYVYADGVQKTRKVRIYYNQADLNIQWATGYRDLNFFVRSPVPSDSDDRYMTLKDQGDGQRQVFPRNNSITIGGKLTSQVHSPLYHYMGTLGVLRNYLASSIDVFGKDQSFAQGEFKLSFLDKIKKADFSNADPHTGSNIVFFGGNTSYPTTPGVFEITNATERQDWIDTFTE